MLSSLSLYRRLVGVQIRAQLQYRTNFWFDVITACIMTIISFGSLALIMQRFGSIGGWSLAEVAFLYGMVETAFGFMDMLFSGFDPGTFGRQIRLGLLDQLLLRPVNVILQIFSSDLALRRLGRITQGALVFFMAISWLDFSWTVQKVLYLPVVFISIVCFFGGLFVAGSAITFWTVDSIEVVNIFTYGGVEMMSYPMHIYSDWMRKLFTYILPAIFLNYYPALYFLDKPDPFGMPPAVYWLSPVVGFGTLWLGLAFFNFGLRYYQSTGT